MAREMRNRGAAAGFTLLFLTLAWVNHFHTELKPATIGLVLLAALPWALPLLAPMLASLKFAGMELNFRELQQQVAENQQVAEAAVAALAAGVGKLPRKEAVELPSHGVLSHGVPKPPREGDGEETEEENADDPNQGRFGGRAERDGKKLAAEVRAMPGAEDLFLVRVRVTASAGAPSLRDGAEVEFHLHPTFLQRVIRARVTEGVAEVKLVAWGAFTVGAVVEGVQLELNLAADVAAPALFRSR
jgi:hypothetical protein